MIPSNWTGLAYNPATESANQIHSDEMAQAYGFRGGLVPGVVISGYLMQPAVLAWDKAWLNHGKAEIKILKPLYEGLQFDVEVSDVAEDRCNVQLIDETNTLCATGQLSLSPEQTPPTFQNFELLPRDFKAPAATPENMAQLKTSGMKSLVLRWDNHHKAAYYLRDETKMASIHQPSQNGYAHGAFLLGVTNWVLAANAYMNPWVHMQTTSQYFDIVPYGTKLIAECAITDLFNKKGHDFVDVDVNIFTESDHAPIMAATLRAIYRMRPANQTRGKS